MVRQVRSAMHTTTKMLAIVLAVATASGAMAAENGLQRYSPGIGGSDMTSPLVPGWYVQMPMVSYHASKVKGDDGKQATNAIPGAPAQYRAAVGIDADTVALQPRVTYLGTNHFLGANVGFTAMLPMVKRKGTFTLTVPSAFESAYPGTQATLSGYAQNYMNGSVDGLGDIEVSPILHWEIGDHQAVTMAPTLVLPTGDYVADRRLNPGYGNFFTFRPSVQYAFIGDGWDVGARFVLSFNTRNKDTGYQSGNIANVDWQAMKFVSDDVRVGLQGYFVRQYTKDSQDVSYLATLNPLQQKLRGKEIVNGNKMSVNGVGPAVGWLKNGGEMLIEGKFLKEFDARNRTEGRALWLTVSKPL